MGLVRRLKAEAVAYIICGLLAVCALAFVSFAVYLGLGKFMDPVWAALLTAAALLLLMSLTVLITRWTTRRRRRRSNAVSGLEAALGEHADPALAEWIGRHPKYAVLATLTLGVAAGHSRSTRRLLQDLCEIYMSTEHDRRSSRND